MDIMVRIRLGVFSFFLLVITSAANGEQFVLGYSNSHNLLAAPGLFSDVKCAFKLSGHNVELVKLPMARSVQMAERRQIDGDIGRVSTAATDSSQLVKIPTPIARIDVWVFARHGLHIQSIEDLKSLELIPILGVIFFNRFDPREFNVGERAASVENALKMVAAGRGDYTLWTSAANQIIEKNAWDALLHQYPEEPLEVIDLHTILSAKHQEHVWGIDQAYQQVLEGETCELDELDE